MEVWNDKNTTKEFTLFGHNLIKDNEDSSSVAGIDSSKNSKFIGISFEGFIGFGGRIKIGFNIGG